MLAFCQHNNVTLSTKDKKGKLSILSTIFRKVKTDGDGSELELRQPVMNHLSQFAVQPFLMKLSSFFDGIDTNIVTLDSGWIYVKDLKRFKEKVEMYFQVKWKRFVVVSVLILFDSFIIIHILVFSYIFDLLF